MTEFGASLNLMCHGVLLSAPGMYLRHSSPLKWVFVDPVEAAIHKHELAAVEKLELHVNFMAIHGAIQHELVLGGTIEGKAGFPILVGGLGERESFALIVDGRTEAGERVVHALELSKGGEIEDHPAPAVGICEQRRTHNAVNGHLLHVPDSIERRFGSASPVGVPGLNSGIKIHPHQIQAEDNLHNHSRAVSAQAAEKLRDRKS